MLNERQYLERILDSNGGDLSDPELELIWNENNASLAEKIDAYGFIIKNMESNLKRLDELGKELDEKVKLKYDSISKNKARILARLHGLIDEGGVKGNLFKIKPVFRKERNVDVTKIEDKFLYQVIEVRLDWWKELLNRIKEICWETQPYFRNIGSPKFKISELPEGHSAVETVLFPSCQIS